MHVLVTNIKRLISDFTAEKGITYVKKEKKISSFGRATVRARTVICDKSYRATLHDVLHAPDMMCNLASTAKMRKRAFQIIIDKDTEIK